MLKDLHEYSAVPEVSKLSYNFQHYVPKGGQEPDYKHLTASLHDRNYISDQLMNGVTVTLPGGNFRDRWWI